EDRRCLRRRSRQFRGRAHLDSRTNHDCLSRRSGRNDCHRPFPSAHQHHHHPATANVIARGSVGRDSVEPGMNMLDLGRRFCGSAERRPTKNRRASGNAGDTPTTTEERAVTIIEMLVVIMVIFILAALVLAASSYVQNKGARARAETEIAAMSAALESYKADNGIYPRDNPGATDTLDARTSFNASAYSAASFYLYEQL